MIDKKRRDITLGEMQDECLKYCNGGNLGYCGKCKFMEVCCHYEAYTPAQLDLSDLPRFNEAQMALLKALLGVGCNKIVKCYGGEYKCSNDAREVFNPLDRLLMQEADLLDLAELLGKDKE